ncbi:MAG: response regulator, partial [Verrucomicrobiaceae bacterium]
LIQSDPASAGTRCLLLNSTNVPPAKAVLKAAGIGATMLKPARPSRLLDSLAQLHQEIVSSETVLQPAAEESVRPASGSLKEHNGNGNSNSSIRIPHGYSDNSHEGCSHGATKLPKGGHTGPRPKLLLAEDNPINQKVTLLQLRQLGYEADVASNGNEVLRAIERKPYDIILMDCQMPELDGYEASGRLRDKFSPEDIHIIALTANAMSGDRERCLAAGMNDYVTKPVRAQDLGAALTRWRKS